MSADTAGRRAVRWLESGLLDTEFYSALRGVDFPDIRAAAGDFVEWGMPHRLSPHPFLDFLSLPWEARAAWRNSKVSVVLDHLSGADGHARPCGPLAGMALGAPAREHMIRAAGRIAQDRRAWAAWPGPDDLTPEDYVAVQASFLEWEAVEYALPSRTRDRTSVVIPTHADASMTIRAVNAVLERAGGHDVEVVVVDNGSPAPVALALEAAFFALDRVRVVRLPQNLNFAAGSNIGFADSTGDVVVFLNNDTHVRRGWLCPLREALEDQAVAGAQPLLLYENDTIQTAGTVFLDDRLLPGHLLVGHQKDDAAAVAGERFSAITGAAMVLRAEDVAELRGFDPRYRNGFEDVDLCLRLLERRPGGFRVAPASLVTHYESKTPGRYARVHENRARFTDSWDGRLPAPDRGIYERLGFTLADLENDGQEIPAAIARVGARIKANPSQLRWSIKLPSTPGQWGDDWGDTHFADALAGALRRLGQDVVTCRYGSHDAGPTQLDDVNLAIRGRYPIPAVGGKLSIVWVISHPDSVDPAEFDGYDLVFAASEPWSALMTEQSGRPVLPLLQATDIDPRHIATALPDRITEAVFVGNTNNGRERPLVTQAVAAGVPLAVYGRGWEGLLPPGVWRSEHLPNHEVPGLYREHGVVLADHWPDMARHGFVANRVFDAVAAGARVISDNVAGIEQAFGPDEVRVCRDPESVGEAVAEFATLHQSRAVTDAGVRQALSEHSFDARARTLLTHVFDLTRVNGPQDIEVGPQE